MSTWNYRLVVTAESPDDRDITLCEVYYDEEGNPNGFVDTAPPGGSTPKEVLAAYERMRGAFDYPVLRMTVEGKIVEVDWPTEQSWG